MGDEVTVTATSYWGEHVDQLLALLELGEDVIADPRGGPLDEEDLATLTSAPAWLEHPDALAEALLLGDSLDQAAGMHDGRSQTSGVIRPVGDRLVLTVEEAAGLLGISRAFAYEAVQRGEIPSIRIGRRVLVPKAGLERLLNTDTSRHE